MNENSWKDRTSLLIGDEGCRKLSESRVAIVGAGGVGGYAAEMLARAGVGHLLVIDPDCVGMTNINRQIIAMTSTVGIPKVEVIAQRLRDINPDIKLTLNQEYLEPGSIEGMIGGWNPDFVIDAIDTVAPKFALIKWCYEKRIPSVSSMGAGAKCDATKIRIADVSASFNCSLAAVIRKRLRKSGITKGVKVVFSEELPQKSAVVATSGERNKCSNVGSISYIPAVFGCCCAQQCIKTLLKQRG